MLSLLSRGRLAESYEKDGGCEVANHPPARSSRCWTVSCLVGPVLERLREPHRADVLLAREIRDRSCDTERAMHRARGHAAPVDRVGHQLAPRVVQRAVLAQEGRRELRVQPATSSS